MPVEPGTEVALDLLHLSTSKGLEIAELERIVGRENETKLVVVTTTGLFKGTDVCLIDAAMLDPYNRLEEHTSELQSLMRISYAVFCLKKKNRYNKTNTTTTPNSKNTYIA